MLPFRRFSYIACLLAKYHALMVAGSLLVKTLACKAAGNVHIFRYFASNQKAKQKKMAYWVILF